MGGQFSKEPGSCKHKKKLHKHQNDTSFHHTSSTRRSFSSAPTQPMVSFTAPSVASAPSISSVPSVPSCFPSQGITTGIPADPPPPYAPNATPTNYPLYVNTFQTPGPGAYSAYIPYTHPPYAPYPQHLPFPQPVQSLNTLQALQSLQHQQQQNIHHLEQFHQMQQFAPTAFQPTQPYENSLLLKVAPNAFVSNVQSQSQQTERLVQNENSISGPISEQHHNFSSKSNLEQNMTMTAQGQQYTTYSQYPRQPSNHSFNNESSSTTVLKIEGFEPGARFDFASKSIPPPPPGVPPNEAQLAVMRGQKVEVTQKKGNKLTGEKGAGYTFW